MIATSSGARALLAFTVAMAVALLAPLASADLVHDRTRFTIWATLLLAIPAVVRFVLSIGRTPLNAGWRAWWTAALAGYLVHLWYGFGVMFAADFAATFATQGMLVAGSNFLLVVVWLASAAVAWIGGAAPWLHAAVTLLFCINALTSTLLFGRPPSPLFGGLLAAAIVVAAISRWIGRGNA